MKQVIRRTIVAVLPISIGMLLGTAMSCSADQLHDATSTSHPSRAVVMDARAEALLKMTDAALRKLRSATIEEESVNDVQNAAGYTTLEMRYVDSIKVLRPSFFYREHRELRQNKTTRAWEQTSATIYASDGAACTVLESPTVYSQHPLTSNGSTLPTGQTALRGFFASDLAPAGRIHALRQKGELSAVHYAGGEAWMGEPCDLIVSESRGVTEYGETFTRNNRLTLSRQDHLVRHIVEQFREGNVRLRLEYTLRRIQLNPPLKPADFAYTPPPGAKLKAPPPPEAPAPPLLERGVAAPEFTVYTVDGKAVNLSDFRGKIVVLDFWATWCYPCLKSLPNTNALAQKLKARGVVTLAINAGDEHKMFTDWVSEHRELSALTFVLAGAGGDTQEAKRLNEMYHISSIPTQYVIDVEGKIVDSLVGYGGTADRRLEETLQKAGVDLR